jgi:hypothetical protein
MRVLPTHQPIFTVQNCDQKRTTKSRERDIGYSLGLTKSKKTPIITNTTLTTLKNAMKVPKAAVVTVK